MPPLLASNAGAAGKATAKTVARLDPPMDALLLAGGFGTRLRPLTYTRPKPLLPVAGRPMLEWALERLPPEVDHVVVAVNWLAEELERHFEARNEGREMRCTVVREAEPLGTAGAVKNCQEHLTSDRFFVINADIVSDMDLGAQLRQHLETGARTTIALKRVPADQTVHYGVATLDDEDPRRIRGFVEKPATPEQAPSDLINAGAYLLEREVLDLVPAGKMVSMEKEIFPQLLDGGLYGWAFDGTWVDVGDPARLREATRVLASGVYCGHGTVVADDVLLDQAVVGQRCRIGEGAKLRCCVLGDDVEVAAGSVLEDCVVGDGERVAGTHKDERIWTRPVPDGYPAKQVGNAMARA